MVRHRFVIGLLACASVAGCATVGPGYHVPAQSVVNVASAQGAFVATTNGTRADALPSRWWALYHDPVLDGLIRQTLAANTQLRVAEANLERYHAFVEEVRSQRFSAGVDAATAWTHPSEEAVLKRVGVKPYENYNAGVSVGYDLDLFGAIRRGVEAASADDEAAVAARDLVRINVVAETVRAYADLCNAGHDITLMQQQIGTEQDYVRLTQVSVDHGRTSPMEMTHQQDVLANVQAQMPALKAAQRNAAFRLATLAGRPPEEASPELLACHAPLELQHPIPVGDGQSLLKRRPDVRAAERRLAASTARIGVATAALYPDIKLGLSVGSTGKAMDAATGYTHRFAVGPLVSWNLNRDAVRAQIAQADAQSQASLATFDGTVLGALRDVETALETYAADLDQQDALTAARDSARHRAEQMEELHKGGRIDSFAMLAAERDRWVAEHALAVSQRTINRDQVTIFLALGGGWE